jgi:hypothetical protein
MPWVKRRKAGSFRCQQNDPEHFPASFLASE